MEAEDAGGRVRVFARLRPHGPEAPTSVHLAEAAQALALRLPSTTHEHLGPGEAGAGEVREFRFDGLFAGGASQEEVFAQVGLPVLQGCLRGVNGTILAYGQTGSGKTHSLLHQGQPDADAGLLPRLVKSLFDHISKDTSSTYQVDAAALQVYNEQVDDLLHPGLEVGGGQCLTVQSGGCVPGLTWVHCASPDCLSNVFSKAREGLVYAETKMNKTSSRSHAIFQVRLTRQRQVQASDAGRGPGVERTWALLSVVDLAGSERVKKSQVAGVHFKEATSINKSLLALGNVVSALASRKLHVPFRDSKLTRILDASIGGNCKTALLVCASPLAEHAHETLSSLDFASRAMSIEVHARVNREVQFELPPGRGDAPEPRAAERQAAEEAQAAELAAARRAAEDASARAERAEARAERAEEAAAEWQRRSAALEAALGAARQEALQAVAAVEERAARDRCLAAEALARAGARGESAAERCEALERELGLRGEELARASRELELQSRSLAEAEAASERLQAEAERREAAARTELGQAGEAARAAGAAASRLSLEAERARAAAEARLAAAEARERQAGEEAELLARKRAELDARYAALYQEQCSDAEARLQAGREGLEARLQAARKRSDAELGRRVALLQERDEDLKRIADQQRRIEEQQRELQARGRELEQLRGQLRARRPGLDAGPLAAEDGREARGARSRSSSTGLAPAPCERRQGERPRRGLLAELSAESRRTFRGAAALMVA